MDYIDLSELKASLKITDDSQDELLNSLIKKVVGIVEGEIGYSLDISEYEERYPANNSSIVFVNAKPITEVESVIDEYGNTYSIKRFGGNSIHLTEKPSTDVQIKFKAGFSEMPTDIMVLIESMTKQAYYDFSSEYELGIKQKKIDTLSMTYFTYSENKEGNDYREASSIENVLKNYRILAPLSI